MFPDANAEGKIECFPFRSDADAGSVMDISIIRELTSLRILVSIILGAGILFCPRKWLLFWIPFLPYSGIWLYAPDNPREYIFISSYIELILALLFLRRFFISKMDHISVGLFVITLFSLPSLYNAFHYQHFSLSLFLLICLLGGAGVYTCFLDHMKEILASHWVDVAVVIWLILGIFIKIYLGARLNQPWFIQRGGGILGSNHVAGVLFLLLPLVKSRWIILLTLLFLVLQFSRGIYLALFIYVAVWITMVNPRQGLRWLIFTGIAAVVVFLLIADISFQSEYGLVTIKDFILSRFKIIQKVSVKFLLEGLMSDSRWDIINSAFIIGRQAFFTGIGFGGFMWGLERLGEPLLYTNAHNMYVTLLVEGGFAFAFGIYGLLIYLLIVAFRTSKKIFAGFLTWIFYGFYAAEIYETGGMVTAGDYYILLFVIAAIFYLHRHSDDFLSSRGIAECSRISCKTGLQFHPQ